MKAVLVEDEPLAADRLLSLLEELPGITVAAIARTGVEAVRIIDREAPDLVFLDIALPDMNGFDVLRALRRRPAVVFVTAYAQFAVRAFEEQALDYLLKPYSKSRLEETVRRALGRVSGPAVPPPFLVRLRHGAELVPQSEVLCFSAEDKYVFLCTAQSRFFCDSTLKHLESTLDPSAFLRIHRRHIVAVSRVRRLHRGLWGDLVLEMNDPAAKRLPVGRAYRAPARRIFVRSARP